MPVAAAEPADPVMVPGQHGHAPSRRGVLRFGWAPLVLTAAVGVVMLWNSFSHRPQHCYDARSTARLIQHNAGLRDWRLHRDDGWLAHQPVLYYALLGKANRLVQVIARGTWHSFYFFRPFHIAFILLMAWLYGFSLVPRFISDDRGLVRWFFFAVFLLPNLYLGQVMVRADHLLFLSVNLLFYLWFRYDFDAHLPRSPWRLACWAGLLMVMGNSRHLAIAAFAVFLLRGVAVIAPVFFRAGAGWRYRARIVLLVLATVAVAGQHYVIGYLKTGYLFQHEPDHPYLKKFAERTAGFDRRLFFLDLEFDDVVRTPNRNVEFQATKAWPGRTFDVAERDPDFRDDNNAFLPRLYSDMWGDHWLYFSGRKPIEWDRFWTHKTPLKRVVLVAAAPFALAYFGAVLAGAVGAIVRAVRRRPLGPEHVGALLFVLTFAAFMCWLYNQPEPGKNNTVKFFYLFAYTWFPVITLAAFAHRHARFRRVFVPYTYALFALCAPLFVFIP